MTKTRQSIQQLSTELANQIAAGEVIERPASVVKELLENAIDAGATQIEIDMRAGGTQLIRVRDNGHGIPEDELVLALAPHATSKIYSIDDLHQVCSMGFRGEALASIASVSELTLISLAGNAGAGDMAWQITSNQEQASVSPASHPPGTTVEVMNLFYNTPVRKRFLKAERTEYKHVEDVVKRVALANFNVAITLKHNQRKVFSLAPALTAESQIERVSRLTSKEFTRSAISLSYENAGLKLTGWLAGSEYSRSQSDIQFFFVNGRMIRDKVITHAIRQAYHDRLYPGRFPVYVLNMEMDPEQVDVNVHPTKHEVRFRQSRLVHDFLYYSLKQALASGSELNEQANESMPASNVTSFPFSGSYQPAHAGKVLTASVNESTVGYRLSQEDIEQPLGSVLSTLDNGYLVTRNSNGLGIICLELARSCLIEEQLKTEAKLVSKPVLIPFSISIKSSAESFINKQQSELKQLGFELSIAGERELMVRYVPALLDVSDLKQACQQLCVAMEQAVIQGDSLIRTFVDFIVKLPFKEKAEELNIFLRQLETTLDDHNAFFHQVADNDFHRWFNPT